MNLREAEALGIHVVKAMLEANALVREKEWVQFGPGSISGVLYQLTSGGCYASKLHAYQAKGRCYSSRCMKTLQRSDRDTLPVENNSDDWATFYGLNKEELQFYDKEEIERQKALHEIVTSESAFIIQLDILNDVFMDLMSAINTFQPWRKRQSNPLLLVKVVEGVNNLRKLNQDCLLSRLRKRQNEQGPWIVAFSDIFSEWIQKARPIYVEYASISPRADYLVRREEEENFLFNNLFNNKRDDGTSNQYHWDGLVMAPIMRLRRYYVLLNTVLKKTPEEFDENNKLASILVDFQAMFSECDSNYAEAIRKMELFDLHTASSPLSRMLRTVDLDLDQPGRSIVFRGDLQYFEADSLQSVKSRVFLFDNYLVIANSYPGYRLPAYYDILKDPIPMVLLVLKGSNDLPVSYRIPKATAEPGNSKIEIVYPFRIKHLGKAQSYTLCASSSPNRQDWVEAIVKAKTMHAESLYSQKAEPFELRVLEDEIFGYKRLASHSHSVVIKGTPLDRAVRKAKRELHRELLNFVCQAEVNCATVFKAANGLVLCAVGTDDGVFISGYPACWQWNEVLSMQKVTQIAVLEEFGLFLIISGNELIRYHLDDICPPAENLSIHYGNSSQTAAYVRESNNVEFFVIGKNNGAVSIFYMKRDGSSSVFTVLSPQNVKKARRRFLQVRRRRNSNDNLPVLDEFYLPVECYGLNVFSSSLAISTERGMEVLTLAEKQTWSVPNSSNNSKMQEHLTLIENRIKNLKPLGMFRLGESEFLVVFEDCAVYVNKHGDISRGMVMEFVGRANNACLSGQYLVLVHDDFVEIRDSQNGRLKQVIAGKDIKLLDDGGSGSVGAQTQKQATPGGEINERSSKNFGNAPQTPKLVMQNPKHETSRLIVELLLASDES